MPLSFMGHQSSINLCTINDDGEFSSYKYIYPKQFEIKLAHERERATLLNLYIIIEDNIP